MISVMAQAGLQNVYTPLPFNVHLWFCIIATAVYLLQFARKKAPHYLLVMAAIDATFVTQYCTQNFVITILFCAEVVLLVCAGVLGHRFNKRKKAMNSTTIKSEE